jgi:hypothetical protein
MKRPLYSIGKEHLLRDWRKNDYTQYLGHEYCLVNKLKPIRNNGRLSVVLLLLLCQKIVYEVILNFSKSKSIFIEAFRSEKSKQPEHIIILENSSMESSGTSRGVK